MSRQAQQQKLLILMTRHRQLLTRATRMLAAADKGWELPSDAEFHTDELTDLDASTFDLLIELTGSVPSKGSWQGPMSYSYEHGYTKNGRFGWLRSYETGLRRSLHYLEGFLTTDAKEIHVGDNINNSVTLGPHAQAGDISNSGSIHRSLVDSRTTALLAEDLSTLRKEMRKQSDPENSEHDIELGVIATAESEARKGNHDAALKQLQSAGRWALDTATKIGVNLASEAIKHATGLS